MLFNSFQFILFFPIVLLGYYAIPKRVRYIWLLVASYFFYMCWNVKYVLLLLASTVITYLGGLALGNASQKEENGNKKTGIKKLIVALVVIINLGILGVFKYYNFFSYYIAVAAYKRGILLNIPVLDLLLPVGISFYTFQALSYTIDVYRGEIKTETNPIKYALFVSFFPQLVAGPIERSKNLLTQLNDAKPFDFEKAREGFLQMLWGYFLKIVIADRIAIFVDSVYADHEQYTGYYLLVAAILFSVQIYCDFAGYSTIAIGAAKILGINLMENFKTPYLATSVTDFWKRWHISLTSWFRDYLYIPLGGNRKGKFRKYINVMTVFLLSGLWHGAEFSYVVWGGINGLFQIIESVFGKVAKKIVKWLRLDLDTVSFKVVRRTCTFIIITFAWIFFRAISIQDAFSVLKSIVNADNLNVLVDGSLYNCGLDAKNWGIMLISILILLLVDIANNHSLYIRDVIVKQDYIARWFIIGFSICFILVFGIWGTEYNASNFIYFQF